MHGVCVYVDADKIVLSNVDHLFELSTPAGTFSSPWASTYVQNESSSSSSSSSKNNYSYRSSGNSSNSSSRSPSKYGGMRNPYALLKHGDVVSERSIHTGLYDHSFVIIGTMVLLTPSIDHFERYKTMLSDTTRLNQHATFGLDTCNSMMDEQSLTMLYALELKQTWRYIHQM